MSTVELDPWGGNTSKSSNEAFQPHRYNNYERDLNQSDEAMFRRYNRWWSRFDQPDPYEGSYNLANPQSFNRFGYVQGDPVNLVDPTGLTWEVCGVDMSFGACVGSGYFGGGGFGGGNGWGNDPNPGRRTIDAANNTNDQRINQTLYGGDSISINSWICFAGVCWYAGSGGDTVVSGVFPSDFRTDSISPILGALGPKDWRPEWPPRSGSYGWPEPRTTTPRVGLPEGMSETPRAGTPELQVPENPLRPGIDPRTGGVRPGATGWERFKVGTALTLRILIRICNPWLIVIDAFGPVILPHTIGVCARNPQACDPNSRQLN